MGMEEEVLKVIRERKDGVYQNELWKLMGIDSRKCSRIITKLLSNELIEREKSVNNGARTYLITVATSKEASFDLLLAGDMFSPCAGCRLACQPEYCPYLTNWIFSIPDDEE